MHARCTRVRRGRENTRQRTYLGDEKQMDVGAGDQMAQDGLALGVDEHMAVGLAGGLAGRVQGFLGRVEPVQAPDMPVDERARVRVQEHEERVLPGAQRAQ